MHEMPNEERRTKEKEEQKRRRRRSNGLRTGLTIERPRQLEGTILICIRLLSLQGAGGQEGVHAIVVVAASRCLPMFKRFCNFCEISCEAVVVAQCANC